MVWLVIKIWAKYHQQMVYWYVVTLCIIFTIILEPRSRITRIRSIWIIYFLNNITTGSSIYTLIILVQLQLPDPVISPQNGTCNVLATPVGVMCQSPWHALFTTPAMCPILTPCHTPLPCPGRHLLSHSHYNLCFRQCIRIRWWSCSLRRVVFMYSITGQDGQTKWNL